MANFSYLSPNEVRKVTRTNIASLFAALMHLNSTSTLTYSQRLLSFMGAVYNRILVIFDINARDTISELKLVRRWFLEYIRDGDISNPGLAYDRWDDSMNTPILLSGIDELYDFIDAREGDNSDPTWASQLLFSLLSIDRIIVVPARPNHSTITDDPVLDEANMPEDAEIQAALHSMGITPASFKEAYDRAVHDFEYEVLSTRGPNGDATWTAHLDARAWRDSPSLLARFQAFLEESSFTRVLRDLLGCIRSAAAEAIPNLNPLLGKLAYIEEWGGKARIVAQLDYWTQMALTPLHHTINSFLRPLVQDGTFDQQRVADRVREWTRDTNAELFCFDLTAATDRLPITFQERILTYLLSSKSFASNWASILVDRTFLTNNGDYITYNTGQPMGARSSFPMLALTHHIIIRIAAARAGITNFESYCVLGDDSAMLLADVAKHYQDIMAALGVPINLSKSIVPSPNALSMGEICKRVFMEGVEISRFNPKLIVNTIRDGRLGPDLQNDLITRGWAPEAQKFWDFMAGILSVDHLTTLIRLNCAPISITGLLAQFKPATDLVSLGKWIPGYPQLEAKHLVELFTYVTASEALKRLDALLRATTTINDSLAILAAANANPKAIPQYVRDTWLTELLSEEDRKTLESILATCGPITPNHPIVNASRAEANRISELLHQLNSHDEALVNRARVGLLDSFRTAVSTIWLDSSSMVPGENRALFQRTLTTLVQLFTAPKRVVNNIRNLDLSYSVVLTSISRLWTVSLTFGGTVVINALRSGITRNINNASSHLDTALKSAVIFSGDTTSTPSVSNTSVRTQKARAARRRIASKNSPLGS